MIFNAIFLSSGTSKKTSNRSIILSSLPENKSNCFVDSVWFETPIHRIDEENELFFRIVNKSNSEIINLEVSIKTNDFTKDLFVDIPENNELTSSILIKNSSEGQVFGEIEIRDPIMYWDDIFYFSYKIEPEIKVLIINGEDKENYISKALSTESSIQVEELNQKSVNRNTFNDKKPYHP